MKTMYKDEIIATWHKTHKRNEKYIKRLQEQLRIAHNFIKTHSIVTAKGKSMESLPANLIEEMAKTLYETRDYWKAEKILPEDREQYALPKEDKNATD